MFRTICCIVVVIVKLALFSIHTVVSPLARDTLTPFALEHTALLAPIIHQVLHLHPGMTLCLLHTGLEDHDLRLVGLVFLVLLTQGRFDPLPDLDIVLSDNRDRVSRLACSCGTADSMNIGLLMLVLWPRTLESVLRYGLTLESYKSLVTMHNADS